ncbi:MAG: hypothetical protein E7663_01995 [Ruminococcaceae bacterium]|nr:hypothetical protein [Oscillospiraceae bacterium]
MVKISGWVWATVLLCATIGILFFHTCIYTLLATVFTVMMLMAIMAVVLPSVREDVEGEGRQPVAVKPLGSYVISETTEGGYVFGIYDTSRRLLVNSHHSYATLQKVRAEISICRESGEIGQVEDRTGRWIKEEFHPKFVLCSENGKCFFTLLIQDEHIMLRSREFAQLKDCVALLERVKRAVLSTDVYYSVDKVSPDGYVSDGEAPVAFAHSEEITLPEAPAVEATVCDEPVPVQEAAAAPEPEAELGPQEVAIRYKRSFLARYIQASEQVQDYYKQIKNELLSYKGVKARISWSRESFKKGNRPMLRIDVKKKSLYLYFALDKAMLDGTKYHYTDVSEKTYGKDYSILFKVSGERKRKHAIELIRMLAEQEMGLSRIAREHEDYRMPYEDDAALIERGLIKVILPKDAVLEAGTSTVKADIGALFNS